MSIQFSCRILVLGFVFLSQCIRPLPPSDDDFPLQTSVKGVYVLNSGLYSMNNSSVSFLDLENNRLHENYFQKVNGRLLGDVGNDMKRYGSKLYIVVNNSNTLEVLDFQSFKSVKQIQILDEKGRGRQPRCIGFDRGKAYLANFDGTVLKIDTASLEIEGSVQVGRNPDGICISRDKIYVSNSGGLSFPNYDSTVSVIDIPEFKEIKKINVGINPYTIAADSDGEIYVCCRGNYSEYKPAVGYSLVRIDGNTHEVISKDFDLAVLNFTTSGDQLYAYNYDYTNNSFWFKRYNMKTDKVEKEDLIQDLDRITTPFGIAVDPGSGDIYVADAFNFQVMGSLLCFDKNGKFKFERKMGLNPQNMVFL